MGGWLYTALSMTTFLGRVWSHCGGVVYQLWYTFIVNNWFTAMSKFEMNMLRQSLSLLTENLFQDFFSFFIIIFYTAFKKEAAFFGLAKNFLQSCPKILWLKVAPWLLPLHPADIFDYSMLTGKKLIYRHIITVFNCITNS